MRCSHHVVVAVGLAGFLGCAAPDEAEVQNAADHPVDLAADVSATSEELSRHGARIFPPHSHPYGRSYDQWVKSFWRWVLAIPSDEHPIFDPTGERCTVAQSGRVWFLVGANTDSFERSCTVPRGTALYVPIHGLLNDYPCPDPSFEPPPGQSLEDFLLEGAQAFTDSAEVSLSIDGEEIDLTRFRQTTPLFTFTGDPSLRTTIDSCITGTPQVGVSDGYAVLLKPLPPGTHTLRFSTVFATRTVTGTYHITVPRHH